MCCILSLSVEHMKMVICLRKSGSECLWVKVVDFLKVELVTKESAYCNSLSVLDVFQQRLGYLSVKDLLIWISEQGFGPKGSFQLYDADSILLHKQEFMEKKTMGKTIQFNTNLHWGLFFFCILTWISLLIWIISHSCAPYLLIINIYKYICIFYI